MPTPKKIKSDLTLLRLGLLKSCDHEVIDRLLHGIETHVASEYTALAQQAREIQSHPDHEGYDRGWEEMQLGDERYFLEETQKLAYELAIVALYKKIEISTKRAISLTFSTVSTASLFQFKEVKKALKAGGIQIESLPNFSALNELRCINNDIKHNGVVSSKLAAYSGWKLGEPLSNLDTAYRRLATLCASYVGELIGALIKSRRAKLGV